MEINLSGRTFVFPNQCACCNRPADHELVVAAQRSRGRRVIHTTTKTWNIPYCTACIDHVHSADKAYLSARIIGVVALLSVALGWFALSLSAGLAIGAAIIVLGFVVFYLQMTVAKSKMSAECARVERAISYLGWQGTLHAFDMSSAPYATAFMRANEVKLVNISKEAGRLLANHGPSKNAARAPRTYIS